MGEPRSVQGEEQASSQSTGPVLPHDGAPPGEDPLLPQQQTLPQDVTAGAAAGAAHQLLADTALARPSTIWPPVEPTTPDALLVEELPAVQVEQQFASLDPQLLNESLAVTAAAPAPVQSLEDRFGELWQVWLAVRYPLVAVAVLLAVVSLPTTTESVVNVLTAYPFAGALSLLLWGLYALPLIWLILRFDFFEREPLEVIAAALVWGGIIATSMAVSANQAVFSLLTSVFGEEFTLRWGAAIAAPSTEECLKTIGIVAVVLLARRGIRSAIDGFVIGAMVGLGFQVVEDFVYTGNLLLAGPAEGHPVQTVLNVFVVRGIGSGLWSHAAYSGIAGLGIGYAFTRKDRTMSRRLSMAALMFGLAWLLHFLWNLPVVFEQTGALGVLLKAAITLVLLLLIVMRNQGREARIFTEYLETLHEPSVATLAEIESLKTYRSREEAASAVAKSGGERAADAVRSLQRAQADLSVAMATGDVERVSVARRNIANARSRMSTTALLAPQAGHAWGVAGIWMALIGVVIPIVGPMIAAALAAVGAREAKRKGVEIAGSVRTAWLLAAVSFLVGLILLLLAAENAGWT